VHRILVIFGTRPEAIKLCPVVRHLRAAGAPLAVRVCVTAQHRGLLDQVLRAFEITPEYDLRLMLPGQSLFQSTSRILAGLETVLDEEQPALSLVQGDTTTTFCGALASFYKRIPVGHVEAGLRTFDLNQPFPEEANRVLTSRLATLHFAPTEEAAENLRKERINQEGIVVTGNTGIDALLYVSQAIEREQAGAPGWHWLDPSKKLILVTAHRRENFGEGFEKICEGLALLARRPDVQLAYPVHPNPNVEEPVKRMLGGLGNVHLLPPQEYVPFVDLMRRCHLILTDSGGVQEEAPSLGKPVLVMRNKTERPEAVRAGTSRLVGADPENIVREAALLLDDAAEHERRSHIHNPYGDGTASARIHEALVRYFEQC